MTQILQFPPPYSPSSPSIFHHNLKILGRSRKIPIIKSCRIRWAIAKRAVACNQSNPAIKFPAHKSISPYLQSEWRPILSGWLCSAVSVYSLSKLVPLTGQLSSSIAVLNTESVRNGALVLGFLFLIRIVANYLQQVFLWEAALNCAYKIRVYVFDRVLHRDLGFFESGNGISPGDVAYRITAEAENVADTVHSLLNTIVPSSLQLSAMASQMLIISPQLSLIAALVIPAMALAVGCLGEKLRAISNDANLSAASLAAYLNEVFPSILFVKANNAEPNECIRFESLASADLYARLKKKQMKVLIPQIVQIMFFVVLFLLGATSIIVSRALLNCSVLVSFMTSLVLLIDPIQDVGKAYNELKQGEPAIERLFNLTLFKTQVIEKPNAANLTSVVGEVKVCNLSFSYGDGMAPVLNELDLHIKAGETIALVGPFGGGKTTLVKLLLRLYEPLSGLILIDGCDIQNIQLQCLRRHVGLVSQDSVLFSGTIAENIGYIDLLSGIDMERVRFAQLKLQMQMSSLNVFPISIRPLLDQGAQILVEARSKG